ncbi:MAG: hypothetical protein ACFFDN_36600, partial [Candidatus Hodarchaeota archaeon]
RRAFTQDVETVETPCKELNEMIRGFPIGRCTAFMGCRGGHKSHLGYLHLLERIEKTRDLPAGKKEAGIIISLRDDEQMTKQHMAKILKENMIIDIIKNRGESFYIDDDMELIEIENNAKSKLNNMLRNNEIEILYFPPGYITPDEFFHRMFMSIHRLKRDNRTITLLFNSLDQISARFPLCAHQPIFIPAMIESLAGERVTNIFIAVDEPGQPVAQYGLLPMADLVLTFGRYEIKEEEYHRLYYGQSQGYQGKNELIDLILLEVTRFSGGEKAGTKGLLELVYSDKISESIHNKPGLYFKKWE